MWNEAGGYLLNSIVIPLLTWLASQQRNYNRVKQIYHWLDVKEVKVQGWTVVWRQGEWWFGLWWYGVLVYRGLRLCAGFVAALIAVSVFGHISSCWSHRVSVCDVGAIAVEVDDLEFF